MNVTKLKMLGLSCIYFLCVAISVTANAAELDLSSPGVTIQGWLPAGSQELPILSFEEGHIDEEILQDIRVENVAFDDDGSTRFQLTHSGPMGRQVFAHVRRTEQDDGFTKSVITSIADGTQMEFLTTTSDEVSNDRIGKGKKSSTIQAAVGQDQKIECPWCYFLTVVVVEATCAATTVISNQQCRANCRYLGGVAVYKSGVCGMYDAECVCMVDPKRTAEELTFQP